MYMPGEQTRTPRTTAARSISCLQAVPAGPIITQRQEQHIMVQALNILTFASDVIAMAAAVVTMVDIAVRRRANRSQR